LAPGDRETQLLNAIANEIISHPNGFVTTDTNLPGLFQEYYDEVLQPLLKQAHVDATLGNLDAVAQAVGKIIGFERDALLLAILDQLYIAEDLKTTAFLSQLAAGIFNAAYQKCLQGYVLPEIVNQMLGAARQVSLDVGEDLALVAVVLGADYMTKINQCAHIKLSLNLDDDVTLAFSGGPAGIGGLGFSSAESHVQANGVVLSPVSFTPLPGTAGPLIVFEVSNAPFNYLNLTYVNGSFSPGNGITGQFCTTLVSDSSGNSISVKAWPDYNIKKSGPNTINIEIWDVESGETWIVGDQILTPPPHRMYNRAPCDRSIVQGRLFCGRRHYAVLCAF
jgi:hypothetical protein